MQPTISLIEALNSLIFLLKQEKKALLDADFSSVEQIAKDKARYSAELNTHMTSPHSAGQLKSNSVLVSEIQKLALENARLLKSTKAGVQQAHARLEALKKRESVVGTYMENGNKLSVHDAGISRQKIA